jgi:hypothetical protein
MIRTRRSVVVVCLSLLVGADSLRASQATSTSAGDTNAKIWVGRYQEIEEYLRTAECVGTDTIRAGGPGSIRCTLPPGGPVARMFWRPFPPGLYRGFWMSYKAEIAAYELDKLLKLDMLPPTVERELKGNKGGAVLWVEKIAPWTYPDPPPEPNKADWDKQLARMRIFDNLIGNQVRNPNNMMRDARWNLVLVDFAGSFRSGNVLPVPLTRIDREFWGRVQSLTRSQLDTALGPWLDANEIANILDRRERMKFEIDRLIAEKGEAAVVLR